MHELDRCGELRGTGDQLARLARCNTVELEAALTDLQNNRAAEVQYRNGSWLIANRRMKQESDIRLKRAESGSLGGSKAQANRIANGEQIPDNDNEIDVGNDVGNGVGKEGDTKGKKNRCSEAEAIEFFKILSLPTSDATWFYWKCEANGWTNGGKLIRDWRATIRSWKSAGYLPSQKPNGNGQTHKPATSSTPKPGSWLSMPDSRPDDAIAYSMEQGRKNRALRGEE